MRSLSQALVAAGRLLERAGRATLWLAAGVTSRDQLRRGEIHRWSDFYATDERVDSGLMDWEAALADAFIPSGSRVLIIGCGTGRDVIALLRRGCTVTGIDPAAPAIQFCRRALHARQLDAELSVGFAEDHRWPPQFDVVWFSWFSYTLIPMPSRAAALARAVEALAPGGRIILSVFRRPYTERLSVIGRRVGRWVGNDWQVLAGDNVDALPGTTYLRYQHFFADSELEAECRAAGLDIVHAADHDSVLVLQPQRQV
jgi:SAM-dependent methyltransferase